MNALLWILQILLALHTTMGSIWKLANSEQVVPSLQAIPHFIWLLIAAFELIYSICLIIPAFKRSWGKLAPLAAFAIAMEMLFFSAVHLASGIEDHGPMVYWLIVTPICLFIAIGRYKFRPIR